MRCTKAAAPTAHPRVCGENTKIVKQASPQSGSSPRVRGKRAELCLLLLHERLIPACAGKTTTA